MFGQALQRRIVQHNLFQLAEISGTATRISVHQFNELSDRARTVPHHRSSRTPRGRQHPTSDDEQPMIVAVNVLLDDHIARAQTRGSLERTP